MLGGLTLADACPVLLQPLLCKISECRLVAGTFRSELSNQVIPGWGYRERAGRPDEALQAGSVSVTDWFKVLTVTSMHWNWKVRAPAAWAPVAQTVAVWYMHSRSTAPMLLRYSNNGSKLLHAS
jgi:hypothetical protein